MIEVMKIENMAPEFGAWTPVRVTLPESEMPVLVSTKWGLSHQAYYYGGCFYWKRYFRDRPLIGIKAWMPMPEPYEEVEG